MPYLLLPGARHSSAIFASLWECVKDLQAIQGHAELVWQALLAVLTSDPELCSPIYLPLPKFKTASYA